MFQVSNLVLYAQSTITVISGWIHSKAEEEKQETYILNSWSLLCGGKLGLFISAWLFHLCVCDYLPVCLCLSSSLSPALFLMHISVYFPEKEEKRLQEEKDLGSKPEKKVCLELYTSGG